MCKLLVNPHGFPFVHALWSFPKVNISLFVPLVIKVIPKFSQPNTRDARVRANKIVSLYVTYLSKISSFPPHSDLIKSLTVWALQRKQYLGCGCLLLKVSATKEQIWGVSLLASLKCSQEKQILQTYNYL